MFITGKALCEVSKHILISPISATDVIEMSYSFATIISFAFFLLVIFGTFSSKTGIYLVRIARSYRERVSTFDTLRDTKIPIIIGMNKLIEVVVSSMIKSSE
jgi:hypothetical protein